MKEDEKSPPPKNHQPSIQISPTPQEKIEAQKRNTEVPKALAF
jgi:hypothetical protein